MRQLDPGTVRRVVRAALDEDLGAGDLTTDALISPGRLARGRIVARGDFVVAGVPVARELFATLDPSLELHAPCRDGDRARAGDPVLHLSGDPRPILRGERAALNFLMRMSGIATATAAAVAELAGTGVRLLDTRKTAPGLRVLDKYAVAVGGGSNHRQGLFDAVMIKDTHLGTGCSITEAVTRVLERRLPPDRITVEVRSLAQLVEAIEAGAGRALLDNMDLEGLREAVRVAAGRIELEASGGLRPGRLRAVAETGVDCLSLGWLTHSAPAADLALELEGLL